MSSSGLSAVTSCPCRERGYEQRVSFTPTLLSFTQRRSHLRLQSHSRYCVWNSLGTERARTLRPRRSLGTRPRKRGRSDPPPPPPPRPPLKRERKRRFVYTHSVFRETRPWNVPWDREENGFADRFLKRNGAGGWKRRNKDNESLLEIEDLGEPGKWGLVM